MTVAGRGDYHMCARLPNKATSEIVQRPIAQREFVVQPQRWKIERSFGLVRLELQLWID